MPTRHGEHEAQVDGERAAAREVYRKEPHSPAQRLAWKVRVQDLKNAQADLKLKREAFYRWGSGTPLRLAWVALCMLPKLILWLVLGALFLTQRWASTELGLTRRASAAVDALVSETRVRAGTLPAGSSVSGAVTTKRTRVPAPEEECPYCEHTYTVRDGLSAKTDDDGERCRCAASALRSTNLGVAQCPGGHCRQHCRTQRPPGYVLLAAAAVLSARPSALYSRRF